MGSNDLCVFGQFGDFLANFFQSPRLRAIEDARLFSV